MLTPREKEVLELLAKGLRNKEIAMGLAISTFTVKRHLENIFKKLRFTNRIQAALYATGIWQSDKK